MVVFLQYFKKNNNTLFWGFLAIYLISYANPKIDKLIEWFKKKISIKPLKAITAIITIFLFFDSFLPDIQPYYYKFDKTLKGELVSILNGDR